MFQQAFKRAGDSTVEKVFLCGIFRLNEDKIFSSFNNLKVLTSFGSRLGNELFWLTEEEVRYCVQQIVDTQPKYKHYSKQ